MMISSIVLFLSLDWAGGAGPAVEAPRDGAAAAVDVAPAAAVGADAGAAADGAEALVPPRPENIVDPRDGPDVAVVDVADEAAGTLDSAEIPPTLKALLDGAAAEVEGGLNAVLRPESRSFLRAASAVVVGAEAACEDDESSDGKLKGEAAKPEG